MSEDLTLVFRLTATLKEPVKYSTLKQAVEITSGRFPYFSVSLRSGLFWHFLEFNSRLPRIQTEEEIPCTAFAVKRKDEPLYRIIVKGKRISVEFVHILTDGSGAMEYMKSLLYSYLKLAGKEINNPGNIILPEMLVSEEEFEDGYNRFFRKLPPPARLVKAWNLPFRLNDKPRLGVIHAEVKADDMVEVSRRYKVSVTEYFVSVYHLSLQEIYISGKRKSKRRTRKVLRIEVPVNMRTKFHTGTMRNFSLFVMPEIDMRLGTFSFEEILRSVHHQLQISADIKQISRFLSSNVSYEKLIFIRILPLFIKKIAIAAIYKSLASRRLTGIVTNMGTVTLPEEMEDMIDSFSIVPPPPNTSVKVTAGLISYKNRLRICFSNITQSHELERTILKHLADDGIHVRMINNG